MRYKICGVRNTKEIGYINETNCNYVGFVFSKSKRQINKEKYKSISKYLNKGIKKVGVFKNEPLNYINEIISETDIDIVQLHGNEDLEYISKIDSRAEIWKSVIGDASLENQILHYKNNVKRILIDAKICGEGKCFDWSILEKINIEEFIIAGGIDTFNIERFLKQYKPYAVDLSSGVEMNGEKNRKLILEFNRKIKERYFE
ncbi:MAG: phosphoribosylanthranilate isomerase [Sarcina sp.]